MSASFAANQFEHAFSAKKLCNWEVPADRAKALKPSGQTQPALTTFIVSDNGHLIGKKKATSFLTGYDAMQSNRWPDNRIVSADSYGGAATMGYREAELHVAQRHR
eukprot:CAMPEP_0119071358 /NCGR_PEP_ID=MMETSP1178-20130426/49011_1 /TAXON_ID=33656 /ORGANISM="unid sp, Strain CCMP2000" /LENGTH=105 /DNA_ID=CAMNT_0007053281 /DNA_START=37 /DNA_END=354 /DNA_ORIENTATION=-